MRKKSFFLLKVEIVVGIFKDTGLVNQDLSHQSVSYKLMKKSYVDYHH